MDLILNVKLIDNEQKIHKHGIWNFSSKSTVNEVLKNINQAWQMNPVHMELFFKKQRIVDLDFTLESLEVANKDEISVKHCNLDVWYKYLQQWEEFNKAMTRADKIDVAHMGLETSRVLKNTEFFSAYISFEKEWKEILGYFMRSVDRTQEVMEKSASIFFKKLFPTCDILFLQKTSGTRSGVITKIINGNDVKLYYLKMYHNAGSGFTGHERKRHLPDLREMVAYRVLNYIGVGPKVFFPYYSGSIYVYYICTEEVLKFQQLDKIDNTIVQKKLVAETYLLSLIMGLRDLNDENFGISQSNTELSIVDFYVSDIENFVRPNIVYEFKNNNNFGSLSLPSEILSEMKSDERCEVAKQALLRWKKIKEINSDLISSEKQELRTHGIKFGSNTMDVEQYIKDIISNYDIMYNEISGK